MLSLVLVLLGDNPSVIHETFGEGPTDLFIGVHKIVNIKLKCI